MAGILKDILGRLNMSRDGYEPGILNFPDLDVDALTSELRILERAEEAGHANLPETGSRVPDSTELDVRTAVDERIRRAAEEYGAQLQLYNGRISRALLVTGEKESIEAAGRGALADLNVQVYDDLNHLFVLQREAEGREKELHEFQIKNSLSRLPHVISPRRRAFLLVLLAILVLIESILNGLFFAKGSEQGLIGGVSQALVFSIFNIAVAYLMGRYGLGLLVHRRTLVKVCGVLVLLAYIGWAVGLNLAVAHFRDLYIENFGRVPVALLWEHLHANPLALRDVDSWTLALLGMLFSVLSVIDAAHMGDLYPGYQSVGYRRETALAECALEMSRAFETLKVYRNESIEEMKQIIDAVSRAELDVRLANEGRERLYANYRAFAKRAKGTYEQLIQRYWEANQRSRTTAAPSRFGNLPEPLIAVEVESPAMTGDERDAERAAIKECMSHYIEAVNRRYEEAVRGYDSVQHAARQGSADSVAA